MWLSRCRPSLALMGILVTFVLLGASIDMWLARPLDCRGGANGGSRTTASGGAGSTFQSRSAAGPAVRVAFLTLGTRTTYFTMASKLALSLEQFFCHNERYVVDYTLFVLSDVITSTADIAHLTKLKTIQSDITWDTFGPQFAGHPCVVVSHEGAAEGPVSASDYARYPVRCGPHVVIAPYQHQAWPDVSLQRFEAILAHWDVLHLGSFSHLYWIDADHQATAPFCWDILGERVAMHHVTYFGRHIDKPFERRPESAAMVSLVDSRALDYFWAQFYGGSAKEFLALVKSCADTVAKDREKGIEALVHDESHLNHYFAQHPPTIILSLSFCCLPRHRLTSSFHYTMIDRSTCLMNKTVHMANDRIESSVMNQDEFEQLRRLH